MQYLCVFLECVGAWAGVCVQGVLSSRGRRLVFWCLPAAPLLQQWRVSHFLVVEHYRAFVLATGIANVGRQSLQGSLAAFLSSSALWRRPHESYNFALLPSEVASRDGVLLPHPALRASDLIVDVTRYLLHGWIATTLTRSPI